MLINADLMYTDESALWSKNLHLFQVLIARLHSKK